MYWYLQRQLVFLVLVNLFLLHVHLSMCQHIKVSILGACIPLVHLFLDPTLCLLTNLLVAKFIALSFEGHCFYLCWVCHLTPGCCASCAASAFWKSLVLNVRWLGSLVLSVSIIFLVVLVIWSGTHHLNHGRSLLHLYTPPLKLLAHLHTCLTSQHNDLTRLACHGYYWLLHYPSPLAWPSPVRIKSYWLKNDT